MVSSKAEQTGGFGHDETNVIVHRPPLVEPPPVTRPALSLPPIEGAVLDVWQTAENGMYSGQDTAQPHGNLRGRFRSDAEGSYAISTIVPVSYPIPTDGPVGRMLDATGRHPWRPAHLHFMIDAPQHRKLVTHLFDEADPYLKSDAVFGVKPSLMVSYHECAADHELARRFGFDGPFREARYDFVLDLDRS